ncbi:unnamed protein product [Angiostrongylus costaricensis]|uniref:PDEase domain-containing protein n=1 Tax=Angiostrongylus costaricensis TaxID=334426 RepID=A0A0R3PKT2_ANGCS|nr:unnamed protein product [Angiostrongylus costaricensis]
MATVKTMASMKRFDVRSLEAAELVHSVLVVSAEHLDNHLQNNSIWILDATVAFICLFLLMEDAFILYELNSELHWLNCEAYLSLQDAVATDHRYLKDAIVLDASDEKAKKQFMLILGLRFSNLSVFLPFCDKWNLAQRRRWTDSVLDNSDISSANSSICYDKINPVMAFPTRQIPCPKLKARRSSGSILSPKISSDYLKECTIFTVELPQAHTERVDFVFVIA